MPVPLAPLKMCPSTQDQRARTRDQIPLAFIVLIAVLSISCAGERMYRVSDRSAYLNRIPPERKYVVLEKSHFKEPMDIDGIIKALHDRNMTAQATNFDWSDYEFTFMLAVENILKKEFEAARNQLTLLSDADFDWQVKLLEIDCARELGQAVDVLKEYQMVYDSAQNPIVKELAKTRYRIYKYGK